MPLRLAIVGCGAVTELGHLPAAAQLPEVRVEVLVDPDTARAKALADRFHVARVAASLAEVASDVDAVILAAPPHVHLPIARMAFERGLHVLCEKPMANTAAECAAMVEAAERSGRVLAVAHTYRFAPNRVSLQQMLEEGKLGSVVRIDIDQGNPYNWPTRTGYTLRREMVVGGSVLNEGLHSLDTLIWWLGMPTEWTYADDSLGGLESNARFDMRFKSGAACTFLLTRTCQTPNRFVVRCEDAVVSFPIFGSETLEIDRDERVEKLKTGECPGFVEMVALQTQDFAESVANKTQPRCSGVDGARVIQFIERCYAEKRSRPMPKFAPLPGATW